MAYEQSQRSARIRGGAMKVMLVVNDPLTLIPRMELIDALLRENCAVVVASPHAPLLDTLSQKGCQYESLSMKRRSTNPIGEARLFLRMLSLIRRERPDVVLTFTVKPNIYGGIACRMLHVPMIANITGLGTAVEDGGGLSRLILRLYRMALRDASCVFFQNASNMALLRPCLVDGGNYRLVPGSGVPLDKHRPLPYPEEDGEIRFLFMGRVMKNKGMDELIAVAQALQGTGRFRLDVLGICEEGYEARLKEAQQKGLLHYHGFQSDVKPWLAACHSVILPSYHEGMANVLLEAAACARPIIASNIPGCQETFDEGSSGLGCEPRSTDSLLGVVRRFMALPHDSRQAMGQAGRRKVEAAFDRRIIIDAYQEEIANAVKEL